VLSLAEFSSSYFIGFCKSSDEFYRPILCSFLVSTHGQDSHPAAASPPLSKFIFFWTEGFTCSRSSFLLGSGPVLFLSSRMCGDSVGADLLQSALTFPVRSHLEQTPAATVLFFFAKAFLVAGSLCCAGAVASQATKVC
jgi:hypothetical protein